MTDLELRDQLVEFLVSAFLPDELWRLVGRLRLDADLVRDVPLKSLADSLVGAVNRRGLESRLWSELEKERPRRAADLSAVRLALVGPPGAELEAAEDAYRTALREEHGRLAIGAFGSGGDPVILALEEAYFPLQLSVDPVHGDDSPSAVERRQHDRTARGGEQAFRALDARTYDRWQERPLQSRSIEGLLDDHRGIPLLVRGDPGSGKSTLLRHLACAGARDGRRLPVHLTLAAYASWLDRTSSEDRSIDAFLEHRTAHDSALWTVLVRALEQGRALVLLDGLDEVLADRREFVTGQVDRFLRRVVGRGNDAVVTSRFVGYRECPLQTQPILAVRVKALDLVQVRRFAAVLYEAVGPDGAGQVVGRSPVDEAAALVEHLRRDGPLRALAGTPLLLTMVCLVRRGHAAPIAHRADLYERFLELFLEQWRHKRNRSLQKHLSVDPSDLRWAVERLALWMHREHGAGTAPRKEVVQRLQRAYLLLTGTLDPGGELKSVTTPARQGALRWARRVLADLVGESGLLMARAADALGFRHKTFQEYLAGCALAEMAPHERWEVIRDTLHDSAWREPLALCMARLERSEGMDFVAAVRDASSELEDVLHRDLVLAARLAGEHRGLDEARVQELVDSLVPLVRTGPEPARSAALRGIGAIACAAHRGAIATLVDIASEVDDATSLISQEATGLLVDVAHLPGGEPALALLVTRAEAHFSSGQVPLGPLARAAERSEVASEHYVRCLRLWFERGHGRFGIFLSGFVPRGFEADFLAMTRADIECGRVVEAPALVRLAQSSDEAEVLLWRAVEEGTLWQVPSDLEFDGRQGVVQRIADRFAKPGPEGRQLAHAQLLSAAARKGSRTAQKALALAVADTNPTVRGEVISGLLTGLSASDLDPWLELADDHVDNRMKILRLLAVPHRPDQTAVPVLLRGLADPTAKVRREAVRLARHRVGNPELRALVVETAQDTDDATRRAAVASLADLAAKHADVARVVIDLLHRQEAAAVQVHTLRTVLRALPNDVVVRQRLRTLLEDPRASVRELALRHGVDQEWVEFVDPTVLRRLMADTEPRLRHFAAKELFDRSPEADEEVIGALYRARDYERLVRPNAVATTMALLEQQSPESASDSFLQLAAAVWKGRDPVAGLPAEDRSTVDVVFGHLGAGLPGAHRILRDAACHDHPTVRAFVDRRAEDPEWGSLWLSQAGFGSVLGRRPELLQPYVDYVLQLEGPAKCGWLLGALAKGDARLPRAVMARFLEHPDLSVRAQAFVLFGESFHGDRLCEWVDAWANHDEPIVRLVAALLARPVGGTNGVLWRLHDDEDAAVRARALARLILVPGWPGANVELLHQWLGVRGTFAGSIHYPHGMRSTFHDYPLPSIRADWLRGQIADALAPHAVRDDAFRGDLLEDLDHPDWAVRQGAAWVLGKLPEAIRPVPQLRKQLDDLRGPESWDVRLEAASVLLNSADRRLEEAALSVCHEALAVQAGPWHGHEEHAGTPRGVRGRAAGLLADVEPRYRQEHAIPVLRRMIKDDPASEVRDKAWAALLQVMNAPRSFAR